MMPMRQVNNRGRSAAHIEAGGLTLHLDWYRLKRCMYIASLAAHGEMLRANNAPTMGKT